MQGFNTKHFSLCTLEMSNQDVIYLTPTFLQSSSESQNMLRPGGTQRPGKRELINASPQSPEGSSPL